MDLKVSFESKTTPLYLIATVVFISCLLISNIISNRLFSIGDITLTSAVIVFPITYIFGDVLTEVWGFEKARLAIWLGFACNALMVILFTIVLLLPVPVWWNGADAYALVLGSTPRIVVASFLAFLVGSFANSIVLSKMKQKTSGKHLWMRTIGSTIVGEGIDTVIFIVIAFVGTMPTAALLTMIVAQYIWKVSYEALATPFTYKVVAWFKKQEGIEVFDANRYKIFAMKTK